MEKLNRRWILIFHLKKELIYKIKFLTSLMIGVSEGPKTISNVFDAFFQTETVIADDMEVLQNIFT